MVQQAMRQQNRIIAQRAIWAAILAALAQRQSPHRLGLLHA
jgi:hypothetical protein